MTLIFAWFTQIKIRFIDILSYEMNNIESFQSKKFPQKIKKSLYQYSVVQKNKIDESYSQQFP